MARRLHRFLLSLLLAALGGCPIPDDFPYPEDGSADAAPDSTLADAGDTRLDSADIDGMDTGTDGTKDTAPDTDSDADAGVDSRICSPGAYQCVGATGDELQQCATDGSAWVKAATCPSAATCSASMGRCTACTPGDLSCSGQQLMKCDSSGAASTPSGSACPTGTICDPKGTGQCDVCVENATFCVGASLKHCAADGQSSSLLDTCATSELCGSSTSGVACVAPTCGVGERRCSGAFVQICNAPRTGWDNLETCGVTCTPSPPTCVNVTQISTGALHSCARLSDGTARCWGYNAKGELGDGTVLPRTKPVVVAGLTNVKEVAAGNAHSCALLTDGSVRCWGANDKGQLGDGTVVDKLTPTTVTGFAGGTAVIAGSSLSCAIDAAKDMYCWGLNSSGQMGDGTKTDHVSATKSQASSVVHAYLGLTHACAIQTSNALVCWGSNARGQLGIGAAGGEQITPRLVTPTSTGKQVAVGIGNTCVRPLSPDVVQCAGAADGLVFGTGGTDQTSVVAVGGVSGLSDFGIGNFHQCFVTTIDGKVSCWGLNNKGQIGNGTFVDSSIPVAVTGISGRPDQLSLGGATSCIRISGSVMCWGYNEYSSLGDGTTTDRPSASWVVW